MSWSSMLGFGLVREKYATVRPFSVMVTIVAFWPVGGRSDVRVKVRVAVGRLANRAATAF